MRVIASVVPFASIKVIPFLRLGIALTLSLSSLRPLQQIQLPLRAWICLGSKYDKNCWNKDEACEKNNRDLGNWFDNYHGSNIDKKGKPIKVLSAFDGLGIYKLKSIGKCRYNGLDDNGIEEDCEHVKFHKCMREKGNDKIYIIPFLNNI